MRLQTISLKRYKRVSLWAVLLVVLALPLATRQPARAANPTQIPQSNVGSSPYDVLELVNQLRSARGIAPLQANPALMAAAQQQSEYQASVGKITHYGPGGTGVRDRAAAAGYGGGAGFLVSENIYGGTNATAQHAVTWWKGDAAHLETMVASRYVDAGVGVATDGTIVYYTLDVGYTDGAPGNGGTGGSGAATAQPGVATQAVSNPSLRATPQADGSIVHTVQEGQTLWTIAAIYDVDLQELLKLNKFSENTMIYIGQQVLVKGPDAPPTPTEIPTHTPTSTLQPTRIPRHTATEVSQTQPTVEDSSLPETQAAAGLEIDPLLAGIGALVAGGLALVVVGALLSGRRK